MSEPAARIWEEVQHGDPELRSTWLSDPTEVCRACRAEKPTHKEDCPIAALEAKLSAASKERDSLLSALTAAGWNYLEGDPEGFIAKLSKMEEALKFIAFTGTDCPAGYERDSFYRGQLHGAIAAAANAIAEGDDE